MNEAHEVSLSGQQRRVVEGSGNQVVVAGAGTGKTETLTQRILHLLERDEACRLHEIVALTFTDKAAGEMRRRVYQSLLQRLLREEDEQKRAWLEALRAAFAEQNRIGTFDAFNHRLLSLHPEYDLLPPAFAPMTPHDERELQLLLVRAFWDHAEHLEGNDRDDFFYLLDRYERPQLVSLIASLAREEREILESLAMERDHETFKQELHALAASFAARFERRQIRQSQSLWNRYLQTLPPDIPPDLLAVLQNQDELRFDGSLLLTQKNTWKVSWRKTLLKSRPHLESLLDRLEREALPALGLWRDAEKSLAQTLQTVANVEASCTADWHAQQVLQRLAHLAIWWQGKRHAICQRRGWADFLDVQRAAWQLLQEQPEVREKLRAGSRHILVDEFQDTNRSQWKFVDAFRSAENVLLVGDGKQAIYGFRGGDISVFETVRAEELPDCEIHELSVSRRSAPAIVEFCNRVFAIILPNSSAPETLFKEAFEAEFQPLECGRDDGLPGSVRVLFAETAEELKGDNGKDEEIERLADALAAFLRELQDDADVLRSGGNTLRQPEYSAISERLSREEAATIGVLFRTHERKAAFEAALRRHAVRYASVKGIGFYQTSAVSDAWNLLRFFADDGDEVALAGVLRSPLVGLSDLALLELRAQAPDQSLWSFLKTLEPANNSESNSESDCAFLSRPEDRRALHIGVPRLRDWKMIARVRRASELLEAVLSQTEIVFCDALHTDAAQRSENWRKVLDLVREREAQGQGSARALAAYFEAQCEADERESEAALPEGGAIQLMTIFAAKGLGFPMTIVAELDGKPRRDITQLRRGELPALDESRVPATHFSLKVKMLDGDDGEEQPVEPVLWTILGEEDRARQDAEFRRLLYVACTRAADHLVLAWPAGEIKEGSWAAMLSPHVEALPTVQCAMQSASDINISGKADPVLSFPSDAIPHSANDWSQRVRPAHATVTQLLESQGIWSKSSSDFSRSRREQGVALHRLLKNGKEPDESHCRSVVCAHNLPQSCAARLLHDWRAAYSWLQSKNCDLAKARREIAFTVPASAARGVLSGEQQSLLDGVEWLSGQIDLLVPRRTEEGALIWSLVDFKTSTLTSLSDAMAERHYDLQLRLYFAAARYLQVDAVEAWLVWLGGEAIARDMLLANETLFTH